MSNRFQNFCLALTTIGATICITPLFVLNKQKFGNNVVTYRKPAPNLFFVIIIPAVDLLLDYSAHCVSYFYSDPKKITIPVKSTVVSRLTDFERALFILGIAVQTIVLHPSKEVLSNASIIGSSVNNCSVFLTLGPIIIYLNRCTTTFTWLRTFLILSTLFVGLIFFTASYYCQSDPEKFSFKKIKFTGDVFVSMSAITLMLTILLCFGSFTLEKLKHSVAKKIFQRIFKSKKICVDEVLEDEYLKIDADAELYRNYVPALHMLSLIVIGVANSYWKATRRNDEVKALEIRNYTSLAAEILVLVIELRIRKNEIARGLAALLKSKKLYVRYISHELRTPLNTAFLGLKLLTGEMKASKNPNDVERYDTLCDVNMSFMAAVDILNDLLCYEKLDSGILKLHKENITVVPFLNDNVSMFAAQAREGGVEITVVTDFDITKSISLQLHDSVFVDKFKMDQVIRNLISNALKFTPRGGTINISAKFVSNRRSIDDVTGSSISGLKSILTKKISWCCCRGSRIATTHSPSRINIDVNKGPIDGYLVVIVKDSGAGISAENQKRLFKDIVQFSPEKLQAGGGSGLGLWISGGIVDLHDGEISVYSDGEGMGSSFTVELPMTRLPLSSYIQQQNEITYSGGVIQFASKTDPQEKSKFCQLLPTELSSEPFSPPQVDPPFFENRRYEVLVVDDSRLNRKMLLKCLHKEGHRCTEAEDGLEAIERVKEKADILPFDAILMDFVMPNMDGPTATRQLRSMGYTGVIFGVTGNGLPSDIEYFLNCGANKVLLKPLDVEAFEQAMGEEMMKV